MQELRKEELHLKDNEALIPVAHFHKVSHCVYLHIAYVGRICVYTLHTNVDVYKCSASCTIDWEIFTTKKFASCLDGYN